MRRPMMHSIGVPAWLIGLLLGVWLSVWPSAWLPTASADEQAETQLAEVNAAIAEIQDWLDSAERDLGEQEQALRRLNRRITEREQTIADNRSAIRAAETELDGLQSRASTLEQSLEAQQALVARAVRASWMSGRDSRLKLLLNQEDPARAARMLHYYAHFNRSRLEQIDSYRDDIESLAQTREAITNTREDLQTHNETLSEQLASLAAERDQQAEIIAELQQLMAGRSNELEDLLADREELEALVEEINRIIVDIPAPEDMQPFADARGAMPWPLQGRVLSSFGQSYSDGNMVRQGMIIAAEQGTPVRAIHHGRVVFADWLRGSGLLTVVDHGNGYISLYGHNAVLNKQSGDWVNRGEPVGTAGRDAGTGSAGVYFEIRHNGQPQDPVNWFVPR